MMVRVLFALLLTALLASTVQANDPIFGESFSSCSPDSTGMLPNTLSYTAATGTPAITCDNEIRKSVSSSAKLLDVTSTRSSVTRRETLVIVDNKEITLTFWLRVGNGNAPITGPIPAVTANWRAAGNRVTNSITLTRLTNVDPVNGFYKYEGKFVVAGTGTSGDFDLTIVVGRTAGLYNTVPGLSSFFFDRP